MPICNDHKHFEALQPASFHESLSQVKYAPLHSSWSAALAGVRPCETLLTHNCESNDEL